MIELRICRTTDKAYARHVRVANRQEHVNYLSQLRDDEYQERSYRCAPPTTHGQIKEFFSHWGNWVWSY